MLTYTPLRIAFAGLNIPPTFSLPEVSNLDQVRHEAQLVAQYIHAPSPGPSQARDLAAGIIDKVTKPTPTPVAFGMMVPHLITFCFLVHVEDVPSDILTECTWALEMLIWGLREAANEMLLAIGLTRPGQEVETSIPLNDVLLIAVAKAAFHFLAPEVDRPAEAARYSKALNDADEKWLKTTAVQRLGLWKGTARWDVIYGVSLVRVRNNDKQARAVLKRLLDSPDVTDDGNILIEVKLYLSRVLRRLGENSEAEECEQWLIKWLQKYQLVYPDRFLQRLFHVDTGATDPVLEALGGPKWLLERKHTTKTEHRLSMICCSCGKREPVVILSLCTACKRVYYCSKECQRKTWQTHKLFCQSVVAENEEIEALKLTDPMKAQKISDWQTWLLEMHNANRPTTLANAIGLHRNPARSFTHVIFKKVVYAPHAERLAHRFRVVEAGVFRIALVLLEIERLCNRKGEGQEAVDESFEPYRNTVGALPILELTYADDLDLARSLLTTFVSFPSLVETPYDPEWRRAMNPESPPGPLQFPRTRIPDAEQIFD